MWIGFAAELTVPSAGWMAATCPEPCWFTVKRLGADVATVTVKLLDANPWYVTGTCAVVPVMP